MKDFTFVITTYNHENYIIEHLMSIRFLIKNYGKNMLFDLIISDDCSSDNTIGIINLWISENTSLFRNIKIIKNKTNIGTVQNLKYAINEVTTKYFKELAGDDKYNDNNIFDLFEENVLLISPVIPFGDGNFDLKDYKTRYKLLLRANSTKKMKSLLKYACLIPAPGVFLDSSYYKDKMLWNFLKEFSVIEDYPTWFYLLNKSNREIKIKITTKPYILYRIGSGISSSTTEVNKLYTEDNKKIFEYNLNLINKYPKNKNVFRYIFFFKRLYISFFRFGKYKEIDQLYEGVRNF